jgi:2-phospho-L-lactate/phosphoenolpyruvate guanylyltransferase
VSVALVIPVKATVGAKQRLSSRLGPEQRRLLALAMAGDMLRTATRAVVPARVVVVTGDDDIAKLATRHGVAVVRDHGAGQSAAVRLGVDWALERGHNGVATVAADCPLADLADLRSLVTAAGRPGRFLRCVPDVAGTGTNAAALRPIECDVWSFGPASLARHAAAAERNGLRFSVLDLQTLRPDCDRPEDLDTIRTMRAPAAPFHVLRQLGLLERRAAG